MAVLLTILKIIGIALLVVLGLIVLALCYVLFAPFKYSVRGEFYDDIRVLAQLRDWLGIARVKISYDKDDGLGWGVHLLGMKKPVFPKGDKADIASDADNEAASGEPDSEADTGTYGQNDADEGTNAAVETKKKAESGNATEKRESDATDKSASDSKKAPAKPTADHKHKKSKTAPADSESKLKKFLRLAGEDSTHRALRFLTEKLIRLIKIIAPKRLEADLDFSIGEPDLTGELTGVLAMCPAAYGKKVSIIPDFNSDNAYARGYIELFGSVRLSSVAGIALSVLFNKDCRKLWKEVK